MIKKIKNIYKIFGPGILMATAAIGGSHHLPNIKY